MYDKHVINCEECGKYLMTIMTKSKDREYYYRTCRKCGAEWTFDIHGATCHTMRVTHSHGPAPPGDNGS